MADYLYGSANVRALENAIIGRDRIDRLLNTKNAEEAYELLSEFGVRVIRREEDGAPLREETLLQILKGAYHHVCMLAPDSAALRLWLYPYDCNNLKAAIKAFVRGIDPASMMFDFGTVPAPKIVEMVASGRFFGLPQGLLTAAEQAMDAYAKTKNPQVIDLLLDRACYEDMSRAANECDNEFVKRLVRVKIDLLNVMIAVRILRMRMGDAGRVLLSDAFLNGGSISQQQLLSQYDRGESALWEWLRSTQYASFAERVAGSDKSLSAVECLADHAWMALVKETKFIPLGLEVMVAFLAAHEYEVKNLRILLAGKEAGIPTQTIRERIRESYV